MRGANSQIEEMKKGRDRAESKLGDLYQELIKAQADVERKQESKNRDVDILQCQVYCNLKIPLEVLPCG